MWEKFTSSTWDDSRRPRIAHNGIREGETPRIAWESGGEALAAIAAGASHEVVNLETALVWLALLALLRRNTSNTGTSTERDREEAAVSVASSGGYRRDFEIDADDIRSTVGSIAGLPRLSPFGVGGRHYN